MKKLCKRDGKEMAGHVRRLAVKGKRPKYICIACGRASDDRRQLCKPLRIPGKNAKSVGS
jgi:hypothetical protein